MELPGVPTGFLLPVLVALFSFLCLVLLCPWIGYLRLPSSMKWYPSRPTGPLSALKAAVHEYYGSKSSERGYREYSAKGQPFALANPSFYPQVLLPPEHIAWFIGQPENVLSHEKANEDIHALPFLAPAFDNYAHLELIKAIRNDLTRNIPNIEDAIRDEVEYTARKTLGHADDGSWREVNITEALDTILFGVCLRVFFGPSLSRDPKYVYLVKTWTRVTGLLMIVTSQLVPWILKPIFGLFAGLPIYYYWLRLIIYLYPTYKQRMECLQKKGNSAPEDMVTWMVDLALKSNPGKTPSIIALIVRLTLVVFLPVDVLIAMTQHFFLDLLGSDPQYKYYETLREEAANAPTPQMMPQMESAIRESLRLNPLSDRMLSRRVVQKSGITLPDGQFLRYGTWIAVAALGVHHDKRNFESPDEYRPFRFCSSDGKTVTTPLPLTSDKFLAFGHGRHSCPGRWFAAHAMKVIIGHILINYDIEQLDSRPANTTLGHTIMPSFEVKVRVRPRTEKICK